MGAVARGRNRAGPPGSGGRPGRARAPRGQARRRARGRGHRAEPTPDKANDARALGATDLLVSTDAGQLERARGRFDLILDTISAPHDLSPLLGLLALNGTLSVVGFPIGEIPLRIMDLTYGRKNLSSSGTGGRRGTAEMLAFCAEHGITADIELLPSAKAGEALDRLDRGDVRYRFVLDLSDLG